MFHSLKAAAVFRLNLLALVCWLGALLVPSWAAAQGNIFPPAPSVSSIMANGTPVPSRPKGYTWLCKQGERCYIGPYVADIAFGSKGNYIKQAAMSDTFWCGEDTFRGENPLPGEDKGCWIATTSPRTGIKELCAKEGDNCNAGAQPTPVMYGVKGHYFFATKRGSFTCKKSEFTSKEFPGSLKALPKACFYGEPIGGVN